MTTLFNNDPKALTEVRLLCHQACQWPSKAARANLVLEADDSHSNLGWSAQHNALVSHALDSAGTIQAAFRFSKPALLWLVNGAIADSLALAAQSESSVKRWMDRHLAESSLQSTDHAEMPYEIETQKDYSAFGNLEGSARNLGSWFQYGDEALKRVCATYESIAIEAPTVRCWPHHFDLGALFALEQGDPETARSIGIGMAPGDTSYDEPYFYCSPYPTPDSLNLPGVPAPIFWNTAGFVALILKASDLEANTDQQALLSTAMNTAQQLI